VVLCVWVEELHTWQKVTRSEFSSVGKLAPLQKQLNSLWGKSKWRGEKVCDCNRDWFAFVRAVQTRDRICSAAAVLPSPKSSCSSFSSLLSSSTASFPVSSSQFVGLKKPGLDPLPIHHISSFYLLCAAFVASA